MGRRMSYAKDKQTHNTYAFCYIERPVTINMELNQELQIQPGDVIIELSDESLRGYLIMDKLSFDSRFETVKDET